VSSFLEDLTRAYCLAIEAIFQCPMTSEKTRLKLQVVLKDFEKQIADALSAEEKVQKGTTASAASASSNDGQC
jgi:hypothetical protein